VMVCICLGVTMELVYSVYRYQGAVSASIKANRIQRRLILHASSILFSTKLCCRRVGDSPVPGSGAYADSEVGAAAATGLVDSKKITFYV
jgi:hypothetical protein